jgi:hypothetical protein
MTYSEQSDNCRIRKTNFLKLRKTHFLNLRVSNTANLANLVLRCALRCHYFFRSTAFVCTLAGIDYFNSHFEDVGRLSFFFSESVPKDLVSDTWHNVSGFYLGSDRVVTTTNVHNIINVSVM